jgi:photosystem II stability/assembly factor-like uncharacterized protein
MFLKFKFLIICFLFSFTLLVAQKIKILTSGKKVSLRGLSVVNKNVVWVSGSNGTVGKSVDGGENWKWFVVNGFEKTDFRDIEAFDEQTALIMGIAEPAYILKTIDGGKNWITVFENKTKGMFLDAMEFWNEQSGIVIGDPIDNKIFIARTFNGGNSWQIVPEKYSPVAQTGEAFFASSGTNVRALSNSEAVFVSGGLKSNLYIRNNIYNLPILQGTESTGANSIAIKNKKNMIVVGGDYNTKDSTNKNCVITKDGGKSFFYPTVAPHGYRSCVEHVAKSNWVCCGLNGVDYTNDEGKNWQWISKESFNVCKKAKKGNAVFFAGANGSIGKLIEE